jgi:glycine cleavage system H protein
LAAASGLKYTPTHEWVKMEGNLATVGITAFAVAAIKEIVFLDLPSAGKAVSAGKPFGAVESVKAVFDLNCPVSGTVAEVNAKAAADFNLLAKDPYEEGWLVKIQAAGADLSSLMDAAAYEKFCAQEHH